MILITEWIKLLLIYKTNLINQNSQRALSCALLCKIVIAYLPWPLRCRQFTVNGFFHTSFDGISHYILGYCLAVSPHKQFAGNNTLPAALSDIACCCVVM